MEIVLIMEMPYLLSTKSLPYQVVKQHNCDIVQ